MLRGALAALLLGLLPAAPRAEAHLGNTSYADFQVRGSDVLLSFRYAAHLTPGLPPGELAPSSRAALMKLQGTIEQWIGGNSRVEVAGRACRFTVDNLIGPDRNLDLEVQAAWTCEAKDIRGVTIRFAPLGAVMGDWQTIASLALGKDTWSTVFTPDAVLWQVGAASAGDAGAAGTGSVAAQAEPSQPAGSGAAGGSARGDATTAVEAGTSSGFWSFARLGVHHIWTGYDHLLFLLAVLLAGGGAARLAGIVTSFTLAHSITLGAAALGLVQLPPGPVEVLIALSIVFVALENLAARGSDRRALVTFAFGLVHGFGFAGVLAQTALPAGGVLVPLLAFNLGVEAGQLAVVAVVLPPLALALRSRHARLVQVVLSSVVALAGAAWAVARLAAMVGIAIG